MRRRHTLGGLAPARLLALALVGSAVGVARAEPTEADVEVYEDTSRRFVSRMRELVEDSREWVDLREEEERQRIEDRYSAELGRLESDADRLRAEAIARMEAFLDRHPNSDATAHVMFRLAELYFEEAGERWLDDVARQPEREAAWEADPSLPFPEDPTVDYTESTKLYRLILERYPSYEHTPGTWYMLGYVLYDELARDRDVEGAMEAFRALVEQFPDSDMVPGASMYLGEVLFDANDFDQAIGYYQTVVDAGPEHGLYDRGLYKLAWSYYRSQRPEQATRLFTDLLDASELSLRESGRASDLRPEAVRYLAISFSDIGFASGRSPVKVGSDWFALQAPARAYEQEVMAELAAVLVEQAQYEQAIEAYRHLQSRWPNHPQNPVYQQRVAQLYNSGPLPDPVASSKAQAEFTDLYYEGSEWWEANRSDPDALAAARGYIEESLAAVAVEQHLTARTTGLKRDYLLAAERYRAYLDRFPFAEDYYEIQWYLADVLYSAEAWKEAEREFVDLLRSTGHPYADGARWQLFRSRQAVVEQVHGKVDQVPAGATPVKVEATRAGERKVYALTPEHQVLIAAIDDLKDARLVDPAFAATLDRDRPVLHYIAGQVFLAFGQVEEGRRRLEVVIERFPERIEAAWAAGLIVDSYQDEGDLEGVNRLASQYKAMKLGGASADAAAKVAEFQGLEEDSAFLLAFQLIEQGRTADAAEAFLAFVERFPASPNVPKALLNAANKLDELGQKERAIRLWERYITDYPADPSSPPLYSRVAEAYGDILELATAVRYYEELYRRFPDHGESPDALFNAGFLRIGLEDFQGAAQNFEEYARRYPGRGDVEQVYWRAGEQWERVGARRAAQFYEDYLRRADRTPDHTIQALHWLAVYADEAAPTKADAAWGRLDQTFAELSSTSKLSAESRNLAAQAAVRTLQGQYDAFMNFKYTKDEKKDAVLLTETKPAEVVAIDQAASRVVTTYQDFDAASAALYLTGAAHWGYVEMLIKAPPPPKFTEEMVLIYEERLRELADPVQAKAISRLETNLARSAELGLSSPWIGRSIALLNTIDPSKYPAEKPEVRGQLTYSPGLRLAPLPIPAPPSGVDPGGAP